MKLSQRKVPAALPAVGSLNIFYREGKKEPSSDEQAIEEVLYRHTYRRLRSDFEVKPGERWLDLGANIGAFAVYCRLRGATAVCFEPEPENFRILKKNIGRGFEAINKAVTATDAPQVQFRKSANPGNHYRGTTFEVKGYVDLPPVDNFYAGKLREFGRFDGIKMDIEGSEGAILDGWLLPRTKKLVLEYHTSRDSSTVNLARRLDIIKAHFNFVKYPKMFEEVYKPDNNGTIRPRFDQLIFALGEKV